MTLPQHPGPRRTAESVTEGVNITAWDGLVVRSIPGVTVRVDYEPGETAAALAALDAAVHRVKAQILDDLPMPTLGPHDVL